MSHESHDEIELLNYDEILSQTPIQQPQEVTLRRPIKERRYAILDDYIIFLQEHEGDIGLIEVDC
ncbi:hypothetical protein CR513_04380, partial [Mucuna pruriens]